MNELLSTISEMGRDIQNINAVLMKRQDISGSTLPSWSEYELDLLTRASEVLRSIADQVEAK